MRQPFYFSGKEGNMGIERKSLRAGTAAIVGAVALRLLTNVLPVWSGIGVNLASLLMFAESGRWLADEQPEQSIPQIPVTEPVQVAQTVPPVEFTQEDVACVSFYNTSSVTPDVSALLSKPLSWDLHTPSPKVLILHTHACEGYAESANYRSLDPEKNMVSVGDVLAKKLEQAGIGVIHDRTLHDQASYDGSYDASRESLSAWLEKYPDICLVLDLHRDAIADSQGKQIGTSVTVNGKETARVMLLLGMGYSWEANPYWEQNLEVGVKLQAQLERLAPGICRPLCLRNSRYNQDLAPGSMLIEVGAAGNTQAQALAAAEYLADAIIALSAGSYASTLFT